MRDGLAFAYGALTEPLNAEQRDDVDHILRGETPPSVLREQAERDAANIDAAVRAGAKIVGL